MAALTSVASLRPAVDMRSHRITGRFFRLSRTDMMARRWLSRTGGGTSSGLGR
jgi:hypothetical protein